MNIGWLTAVPKMKLIMRLIKIYRLTYISAKVFFELDSCYLTLGNPTTQIFIFRKFQFFYVISKRDIRGDFSVSWSKRSALNFIVWFKFGVTSQRQSRQYCLLWAGFPLDGQVETHSLASIQTSLQLDPNFFSLQQFIWNVFT